VVVRARGDHGGEDNASQLGPLEMQLDLEELSAKIPESLLNQYFIGVGLN
jgi:hypothetical protein